MREVDREGARQFRAAPDVVQEREGSEGVRVDQVDEAGVLVTHFLLQHRKGGGDMI